MFDFIFMAMSVLGLVVYRRQSKPTNMFFEPEQAKCEMVDKFLLLQSNTNAETKVDDTEQWQKWQQECKQLHDQLGKQKRNH